ncbi:MAG: two-component system response regulator NarL [Pseudomonadota bacterium]|nr:two-component system response regulator NarL [Pseudomonadota bacterium]
MNIDVQATVPLKRRIIVIDDHPLFRKGVAQLIDMDDTLILIAETASGHEGIELAREMNPDLVLLDLNLKDMNGIDALKSLKDSGTDALVIMLTVSDSEEDILMALRAGADGYLLKDMEPDELRAKLATAAQGGIILSTSLHHSLIRVLNEEPRPKAIDESNFTEREKETLKLLAAGKCNKMISRDLGITEGTVKVHVKHILKKLNLRSRLQAAVWMLERMN